MTELIAGRGYARVYRVSGKADVHESVHAAIETSGGEVRFESEPSRAPAYFGIEAREGERVGVLAYLFRANNRRIRNRPADEHRLQVRYGSEETWHSEDHPLGFDVAGVDVTLVLGVHVEAGVLIALDPPSYDPLPMGISIELKDEAIEEGRRTGWHVLERETRTGRRRDSRASEGLETVLVCAPDRLLDLVRFEREAQALGLDPPLRYKAALAASSPMSTQGAARHVLERDFDLSSQEILDIIRSRSRLAMAVRGGVAEHHLERTLDRDPAVADVVSVDLDGGDFRVRLRSGIEVLVECKNASPKTYADGAFKVEVQKTRSSKGDPASRYYRCDQFDVVAACLFAASGRSAFRYLRATGLVEHSRFAGRIAAMQRVDDSWSGTLAEALDA